MESSKGLAMEGYSVIKIGKKKKRKEKKGFFWGCSGWGLVKGGAKLL